MPNRFQATGILHKTSVIEGENFNPLNRMRHVLLDQTMISLA